MKHFVLNSIAICLCLLSAAALNAQTLKKVPANEVLPFIAAQEDCPLKIESFAIALGTDNRYVSVYQVKNTASKNITSYRIARMFDVGTGYMEYGPMPANKLLVSGQTVGTFDRIGNLTGPDLHRGKLKAIAFIMIVSVSFDDGTSYSAESLYDALKERITTFQVE